MDVKVSAAKQIRGSVRTAGDKSVSHRYAMLAGIAEGTSEFENFSSSADCASTLGCMEALGATVRRKGNHVEVDGVGGALSAPSRELDCGNSGSTMRMLSGVVAAHPFTSVMSGDASLSKRPMRRVIDPLQMMGARIESHDGCAPLTIHGAKLKAMEYQPPVASAQVKSCVLLAGLFAEGETTVIEPVRTRDHTELAVKAFGGEVAARRSAGERARRTEAARGEDLRSGRPVFGHLLFVRGGAVSGIESGGGFGAAESDPLGGAGCARRHGGEDQLPQGGRAVRRDDWNDAGRGRSVSWRRDSRWRRARR